MFREEMLGSSTLHLLTRWGSLDCATQPRVPVSKADSSVSLKFFEVSGIFQVSFFFV